MPCHFVCLLYFNDKPDLMSEQFYYLADVPKNLYLVLPRCIRQFYSAFFQIHCFSYFIKCMVYESVRIRKCNR